MSMPNVLISLLVATSVGVVPLATTVVAPVFTVTVAHGARIQQSPVSGTFIATVDSSPVLGARDPSYAGDGRLAVAVRGDIWVQDRAGSGAQWLQLTSGPSWDRQPAWSADGNWVTFSSDRAGNFDLWRVRVASVDAQPERLTTSAEPDGEPTLAADGRTVFVRGRGATARLWVREQDGSERRLTKGAAPERWPVFSPDGSRLAYVTLGEQGNRLRIRSVATDQKTESDSVLVADQAAERPTWAPDGDRVAFTVGTGRGAVYVTGLDGQYANLVVEQYATPAWNPDGGTLALASLPPRDLGYNGDPDRLGDREVGDVFTSTGRLWLVDAPAPAPSLVTLTLPAVADRARYNAQTFDAAWTRTLDLYYSGSSATARRAKWETLRDSYRPRALAAADDEALERVIHQMLRERPALRESATGRAAVSSAHPVATEAGLEIFRQGGNVVDAAVAVSFALGVVEPDASGMGGYGQLVLFERGMQEPEVIEFMARVPEAATLDNASLLSNGRLPRGGPVVAIVPGTVAAMYLAWKEHGSGKLDWSTLLQPAIRAARDGYEVSDGLATTLATERDHFLKYPGSTKLFFRDGQPLQAGDTLRNPDLQWTLEQVASGGADAFYKGAVAKRMVADLRSHGNVMSLVDMARYYAVRREAVGTTYRGYTLYSSAPPVSGGATLAAQLNLLEQFRSPKPYSEDAATLHAMVSAWQLVPSSRGRIADPGLWPVDVLPFTSKEVARSRWNCFDPSSALSAELLRGDSLPCASPPASANSDAPQLGMGAGPGTGTVTGTGTGDEHATCDPNDSYRSAVACHSTGTTAFVVADGDGNVVSVTQTLGTWGGNFYVSPGLGFLYNDKLGSYGSDPTMYGARLPYARHGSTIAPTVAFTGSGANRRAAFAVGAAGNAWITSAVYETVIGMIDQKLGPQAALELPRFMPAGRAPDGRATLLIEDGFSPDVEQRMQSLGYRLQKISLLGELRMGYGSAIRIENGRVTAGADPRRSGAAGAVP